MMFKYRKIYQSIAFTLIFLMSFSSVGLAVDMHFCKGDLKSINFFGKAKTCHQKSIEGTKKQCPHHKMMGVDSEQNDCCNNQMASYQTDQATTSQINFIDFENPICPIVKCPISMLIDLDDKYDEIIPFEKYKPPLIQADIPILVQSFLL